jgi:pimeloyl-ACP methyl ester carboxylesterase
MPRFLTVLIVVIALLIALVCARLVAQHRVTKRIAITSSDGIDSLEEVSLGGAKQWILIRGWHRSKPLLLFLHGGPGFSEMPFAWVNSDLEKDFVVVHWDQRGAGKSFPAPGNSLDVDQFVSDTRELSDLLLKRFGAEKLFLVGHSWGSLIGAITAARYPERFFAYVGVSQFADAPESERMMYRFALKQAEQASNQSAIGALKQNGPPPYDSMAKFRAMKKWVSRFNDRDYHPISRWQFIQTAFASPVYSWRDLANLAWGARASFEELWREVFYKENLFRDAPRIDVPVYFLEGRHDRLVTASSEMAERYFATLEAPKGKQLIWFENSGHWPQLEESARYQRAIREIADVIGSHRQ